MKNYIKFRQLVAAFLFIYVVSCDSGVTYVEKEEPIWDTGTYQLSGTGIKLDVYIENGLVRYQASNLSNKRIFSHRNDISTFQKWAFCWDQNATLWIFSSDVGHTYWKYDTLTDRYKYYELDYRFDKTIVPQRVRDVMKGSFRNLE